MFHVRAYRFRRMDCGNRYWKVCVLIILTTFLVYLVCRSFSQFSGIIDTVQAEGWLSADNDSPSASEESAGSRVKKESSPSPSPAPVPAPAPAPATAQTGYVIENKDLCHSNTRHVIYVMSRPDDILKRDIIRATWGSTNSSQPGGYRVVYMLESKVGRIVNNVEKEQEKYGDIVQFVSTNTSQYAKDVLSLRWLAGHCSNVRFAIRSNDDTFVNVPVLVRYLNKYGNKKRIIAGIVVNGTDSTYCKGPVYILSGDLIESTLVSALYSRVEADDRYITGTLQNMHLENKPRFVQISQYYGTNNQALRAFMTPNQSFPYLFVTVNDVFADMTILWKLLGRLKDHRKTQAEAEVVKELNEISVPLDEAAVILPRKASLDEASTGEHLKSSNNTAVGDTILPDQKALVRSPNVEAVGEAVNKLFGKQSKHNNSSI